MCTFDFFQLMKNAWGWNAGEKGSRSRVLCTLVARAADGLRWIGGQPGLLGHKWAEYTYLCVASHSFSLQFFSATMHFGLYYFVKEIMFKCIIKLQSIRSWCSSGGWDTSHWPRRVTTGHSTLSLPYPNVLMKTFLIRGLWPSPPQYADGGGHDHEVQKVLFQVYFVNHAVIFIWLNLFRTIWNCVLHYILIF